MLLGLLGHVSWASATLRDNSSCVQRPGDLEAMNNAFMDSKHLQRRRPPRSKATSKMEAPCLFVSELELELELD